MKENKNQSVVVENAGGDDTEIDLVELFYVFLNRIWLLVICMAIGGAAAFVWTACFIKPVYKTSAEIYVVSASNNSVVNLADLQLGSAVKTDYMELMISRPVLEKVIESLNVNKTVNEIRSMVSITNKADTRILQIAATSTDPQLATDVANELATQSILLLPEIMENEPPNLVSTALFPTAPAGPSIVKNTLLGAILGFVLCGAVLVVIFLSDRSFKGADDMQKYFGMMPLAVVPTVQLETKSKHTARGAGKEAAK